MGSVNSYNVSIDQTVQLFDQFYDYSTSVSAQEYDAVYSFFRSQFATAEAAGNFTVALFRISENSRIPVMDLLSQIEGLGTIELTLTLAYYLNNLRSASTLLGLNQPVTPNFYVARNVKPWASLPKDCMWSRTHKSMWAKAHPDIDQDGNMHSCVF